MAKGLRPISLGLHEWLTSGIGAITAQALAPQGAAVILGDRNSEKGAATFGQMHTLNSLAVRQVGDGVRQLETR